MPSSAVIASFGKSSSAAGAATEPRERDLHRRAAEALSDVGQDRRLQRGEAAERKERHVRDAGGFASLGCERSL